MSDNLKNYLLMMLGFARSLAALTKTKADDAIIEAMIALLSNPKQLAGFVATKAAERAAADVSRHFGEAVESDFVKSDTVSGGVSASPATSGQSPSEYYACLLREMFQGVVGESHEQYEGRIRAAAAVLAAVP